MNDKAMMERVKKMADGLIEYENESIKFLCVAASFPCRLFAPMTRNTDSLLNILVENGHLEITAETLQGVPVYCVTDDGRAFVDAFFSLSDHEESMLLNFVDNIEKALRPDCPNCERVCQLLESKGFLIEITELDFKQSFKLTEQGRDLLHIFVMTAMVHARGDCPGFTYLE